MIIHSYFTDGMYENAQLFLDSFKWHNGEDIKIILDSRDINEKQIKNLKKRYGNLEIRNKSININKVAEKAGISVNDIKKFKKEIETDSVSKNNKVWKLYISVEERYRDAVYSVFSDYKDIEDYLFHMDIDFYFRKNIQDIMEFIKEHDISIRFRKKAIEKKRYNRCVLGNMIGLKLSDDVENFLKTWHKKINAVPLSDKQKGFGQASFYYAYLDHRNKLDWGDIPPNLIPKNKAPNAYIWSSNRGGNKKNLKKFWEDFKNKEN